MKHTHTHTRPKRTHPTQQQAIHNVSCFETYVAAQLQRLTTDIKAQQFPTCKYCKSIDRLQAKQPVLQAWFVQWLLNGVPTTSAGIVLARGMAWSQAKPTVKHGQKKLNQQVFAQIAGTARPMLLWEDISQYDYVWCICRAAI
eukprot:3675440-Amphidinium_carterae.1